jgi:hypothetical protein
MYRTCTSRYAVHARHAHGPAPLSALCLTDSLYASPEYRARGDLLHMHLDFMGSNSANSIAIPVAWTGRSIDQAATTGSTRDRAIDRYRVRKFAILQLHNVNVR